MNLLHRERAAAFLCPTASPDGGVPLTDGGMAEAEQCVKARNADLAEADRYLRIALEKIKASTAAAPAKPGAPDTPGKPAAPAACACRRRALMFDRYVQAQSQPANRGAKRILIIVSIALHVAAVFGLIIYSFVHVDEVPPPLLTVTFFSAAAPPPPPPPPPPAGKKKEQKKEKPKFVQPNKQQPLVQPKEPEKEEEPEEEEDGEEGGQEGGVKGGQVGGVVGGVLGGVVGAPPPPPPPKPKTVAYSLSLNDYVSRDEPHLPDAVKAQHKGEPDLMFFALVCVDTGGAVTDIKVKVGITGADESILRTMRSWKVKPQPIPICYPVKLLYTVD